MPAPFGYPAIRGTTSGAPGTGAFTPNAASAGFRAWSNVPQGVYFVRFEDGASLWELAWTLWNGTTLSRSANQVFDGSSGANTLVNFSAATATATLTTDPFEVQPDIGGTAWFGWKPQPGATNFSTFGQASALTTTGTGGSDTPANTNALAETLRQHSTSLTTANAQAGYSTSGNQNCVVVSSVAGRGGFMFTTRFGASQIPSAARLFVGVSSTTLVGFTSETSSVVGHVAAFGKDSSDTNIQLLTNSNAGSCTKIDTGIPWTANGVYEATIWMEPGGGRVYALLIRVDTGAIFYTSTTTDIPGPTVALGSFLIGGLSATTGTALILSLVGGLFVRHGS